jgi:menaquinone-9 beta-reductase
MNKYDAAIVGAGPAGSSTAIRLARAGLKVALVEQKKFPRQKLCGEFISPECVAHFDELGVTPKLLSAGGAEIARTVFYSRSGRSIDVKSEWFGTGNAAIGLSRAEMDLRLMEKAREVNVDVFEETSVIGLLQRQTGVEGIRIKDSAGSETEIPALITIDATGRGQVLSRRLDSYRQKRKRPPTHVAFKAHLSGAKIDPGSCEIFAYSGGYGGCNNVEAGLANLCFIADAADVRACRSDPMRVMQDVIFRNVRAADVLARAKVESEWLAVPIDRFGRSDVAPAVGLIAIGDAAAFIDPFTGSGILMALESGRIAASSVIENISSGVEMVSNVYSSRYSSTFERRLRFTSLLRRVAFIPFLADATILALSASSSVQRYVARSTRTA